MTGFIDKGAPDAHSEYVRYLDGDIYGKILFKNFALNILRLSEEDLRIPSGKWGDVGAATFPTADVMVRVDETWIDVEIKFARINIANRTAGQSEANWAFGALQRTPSGVSKRYDLLFAVGARVLGFEDPAYWTHLRSAAETLGIPANTLPHEPDYLKLCGAFILPSASIKTNFFRVTHRAIPNNALNSRFAWLSQPERAAELWRTSIHEAFEARSRQLGPPL